MNKNLLTVKKDNDITKRIFQSSFEKEVFKMSDKKKKVQKVRVQAYIPVEANEKIDGLVDKMPDLSKTQVVSNLLLMGLDDAKLLDNVGLLRVAEVGRLLIMHVANAFDDVSLTESKSK